LGVDKVDLLFPRCWAGASQASPEPVSGPGCGRQQVLATAVAVILVGACSGSGASTSLRPLERRSGLLGKASLEHGLSEPRDQGPATARNSTHATATGAS